MIFLDDKVKVENIRETIRSMRKLDKEAVKALRNELKGALLPTAKSIASKVPTQAPLSGFNHNVRTRWTGARAGVSFTPGTIRRGQDVHPLVSIRLTGKGNSAGFDVAEMAGTRGLRYSKNRKSGKKFVQNLTASAPFKFKGGRFAYGYFLRQRKGIQKKAVKVIDKFAKKFNKKVSR